SAKVSCWLIRLLILGSGYNTMISHLGLIRTFLKRLADEMPARQSPIDSNLPDDTLDLFVDLTINPVIDILSWLNIEKLDNAEVQCSKALKKLQTLLGQLGAEHDLRTKDYQSQLDTLKRIEQPYIKKVMRHIPENMKFKEPEYLQTIGMNP
ncbi:hypothetical protein ACB299_25870, partial [Citrobacter amalonaticus]